MTHPTKAPSPDQPSLVVRPEELAGIDRSVASMAVIPGSRMFEIKDALSVFTRSRPGEETYDASQGDGGASLPGVPPELFDRANALQKEHGSGYDKPFGTPGFRKSVVENYWNLEEASGWGPDNIIACQGGRDALLKIYDAVQALGFGRRGDFILVSRVPWISYNWGPYSVGSNVMLAPGREEDAWALTEESIAESVRYAQTIENRKVAALVITSPDNPTGRTIGEERQASLARAAFSAGVPYVVFDWIYHRVTDGPHHDLNRFLSRLEPTERERCIFLDGLTKSLGASNVRNAHVAASKKVVKFIQNRASHGVIPSFYGLAVAMAAYEMGYEKAAASVVGPTNESRKVMASFLEDKGIRHILGKGYYAFLYVGPWMDRSGMADSAAMGAYLAEKFGLAVVPGVYFSGFASRWIRFSYALPPGRTRGAASRLWEALEALR
ncbi:MAG: aminotransferase class I/II-fold pyridoxal phosphate-dependent enzyme [Acidobacteriota bacterium]|jgi:aspartate aminotransferase